MVVVVRGKAEGGLRFVPDPGSRGQAGEAGGLGAAAGSCLDNPWPRAQCSWEFPSPAFLVSVSFSKLQEQPQSQPALYPLLPSVPNLCPLHGPGTTRTGVSAWGQ